MIAIIAAMDPELRMIRNSIQNRQIENWNGYEFIQGRLGGKEVVAVRCGVGKVLTALITQRLCDEYSPSAIIMSGIAGSINPEILLGDIVAARDCIQHDLDATMFGFSRGEIPYSGIRIVEADTHLFNTALGFSDESVKSGRVLTGDQFITGSDRPEYAYLKNELEGDLVEMEGAASAITAAINKTPFLLIRVVSDNADGKAPENYNKFLKSASERSYHLVEYILGECRY